MPTLPFDPVILILIITLTIFLFLYLVEYNKRKKLETAGERILQQLKKQGLENLQQNIQKSQDELEAEAVKLEDVYSQKLSGILDSSRRNINAAQAALLQFMTDLQKRSAQFEEASKASGEQRINQLFDRVENRLSDFLIQTEQKSTGSIELELRSTRQLIETYKNQQLKLIDENIIAMMEQTLNIVLAKKLSLTDQLDLVYEALERAKVEKFIV